MYPVLSCPVRFPQRSVFRSEWCGQFSGEREHAEKDPRLGMKLRMKFDASLTACELSL